jgi:hypothetical protein
MSETPDGVEAEIVESVTDDGTEPEVLYDPDSDDLQDEAPEAELTEAEDTGAFVETEVQDPDGSDSE